MRLSNQTNKKPQSQVVSCCKIAEGFRFMPLSLVRLRTFWLSTWVSERQLRQVLTRVRAGGWRCHSDVITVRDDTGWQGAGDVTHRKHAEVCVRRESWVLDAKQEGSIFEARRREANVRSMGGGSSWGPNE